MASNESAQTQYLIDRETGEVHQLDCSYYDEESGESVGFHESHMAAVTYVVGLFGSGQIPSRGCPAPCKYCYPLHENLKASIFDEGSSWRHNAFIEADWGMYAMSYKSAADLLVEQSMEYGVDALVYAVMFLYRHYLEIRIKDVVLALRAYFDKPYKAPYGHDLMALWNQLRELMECEWDTAKDLLAYDAMGARIDEFHRVDQTSQSFRYPVTKDGVPSLGELADSQGRIRPVINLIQVKWVVDNMAILLEGTIDMADAAGQYRTDAS